MFIIVPTARIVEPLCWMPSAISQLLGMARLLWLVMKMFVGSFCYCKIFSDETFRPHLNSGDFTQSLLQVWPFDTHSCPRFPLNLQGQATLVAIVISWSCLLGKVCCNSQPFRLDVFDPVSSCIQAGDIHIWDRKSAVLLHQIHAQDVGAADLTCIAWNYGLESQFMFAVGGHDGAVKIWSTPTPTDGVVPQDTSQPHAGTTKHGMEPSLPKFDHQNVVEARVWATRSEIYKWLLEWQGFVMPHKCI